MHTEELDLKIRNLFNALESDEKKKFLNVFEIVKAMTEIEVLKCAEAMRHIQAGDMESARAVVTAMTEPERDKLLLFLKAFGEG